MWYKHNDSVAANTTELTAEETRLTISRGVIIEWDIGGPVEGANLLNLKVFYGDHQIIPYNRDKTIWPALQKAPIQEYYQILQPPYELKFKAWNEDDTFPHEFFVGVTIMHPIIAGLVTTSRSIVSKFRKLFGGED